MSSIPTSLYSDEEDAMPDIVGASISYRLAFGPNAGRKALTLRTLPAIDHSEYRDEQVSRGSEGGPLSP